MASYFITEQYLKETSIIDENVDAKYLQVSILEAQDIHIQPILGSTLYNELISQIAANTVTALNTTLLDTYISKALKYWTLYRIVDTLVYKFSNKTIGKKNSENTTPVENYDVVRLKDGFKNDAEWYTQRLVAYLCENRTSYESYMTPGNGSDVIHPETNNYTNGLYLGNTRKDISKIDRYENTSE
jgi:hypothetical protein